MASSFIFRRFRAALRVIFSLSDSGTRRYKTTVFSSLGWFSSFTGIWAPWKILTNHIITPLFSKEKGLKIPEQMEDKVQQPSRTNLDYFLLLSNLAYPNNTPPETITDARRVVYLLKIIDMLWFDGDLDENPKSRQAFFLNQNWPTEPPPDGMNGICALDESALKWICKRMRKPYWANHNNLVGNFCFADLVAEMKKPTSK